MRISFSTRRLLFFLAFAFILFPFAAHAYAGPGAGFAVLSSFWSVFVAFLYSFYAIVTWPFRQLYRFLRHRNAYGKAVFKRAVILGFDGMDPELAERYMNDGTLPNLAKLRDKGTFNRLGTTFPPISPVAWSTFMTGVNPGKHNIFDFLARDTSNYLPFLSSAEIKGPKRRIRIGKYSIPFGKTEIKALRKGTPFWHWLGEAGIFSSVIRVPVTFPPEKFRGGVLLSGMCVPDLQGSQGTFCLCTTRTSGDKFREGGIRVPIQRINGVYRSYVPGPDNPLAEKSSSPLRLHYELRLDPTGKQARFIVGSEKFSLKVGEYSDWLPVKFKAGLGFTAHGICRFYLKEVSIEVEVPEVEVYVTPVNIDPEHPDLPISHPLTYSIYLAKLNGAFATLGLAEDTWALNEHVLDDDAFLAQAYGNHEDRERMLFDALDKTRQGLCTCVFDTTDRVQHMFWRYLSNDNPAARDVNNTARQNTDGQKGNHQHTNAQSNPPPPTPQQRNVIPDLYQRMDRLIGRVMEKIDDQTLFMVISDHGFKSFARGVNLNTWLHQNGYLALKAGATESGDWFEDVDWSRTRAYTMGLNGLYLNLKGREKHGIVDPAEAAALKEEIKRKLNGLVDPASGAVGITGVFITSNVYRGPFTENAPDLLIGYGEGYRASWDTVMGKVTSRVLKNDGSKSDGSENGDRKNDRLKNDGLKNNGSKDNDLEKTVLDDNVFEDNIKAWSGDHCIDPRLVPGVLFSSHKFTEEKPAIVDVAPTILRLFGLPLPAHFDGKPWNLASQPGSALQPGDKDVTPPAVAH